MGEDGRFLLLFNLICLILVYQYKEFALIIQKGTFFNIFRVKWDNKQGNNSDIASLFIN
ncbi:MAG: hypothetical protein K0Q87_1485 [Neobacillus sp.]|jgi:hypothetical protein|nr:hypothetical protein [Neobacillus sp.]